MVQSNRSLVMDLQDVAKTFKGKVHALQGIDLQVHPGEVFGLLGPNGAGKSTLVKILMTVIRASRASGTVLGEPIGHKPTLARIGYLPELHNFPPYLTAREVVEYYGALAKVDRMTRHERSVELLEMLGMAEWVNKKVGTFSKGMQKRVGLAQSLIADPELILLDEPTDGLDPLGRREVRGLLEYWRRQGKTVFLNSHLLGELEKVCDRVAILVQGKVVQQGRLDDLTAASGTHFELTIDGPPDALAKAIGPLLDGALVPVPSSRPPGRAPAPRHEGGQTRTPSPCAPPAAPPPELPLPIVEQGRLRTGQTIEIGGASLRVKADTAAEVQPVIDAVRAAGLNLLDLRRHRQSLEDLFVQTVAGNHAGPVGVGAVQGGRR